MLTIWLCTLFSVGCLFGPTVSFADSLANETAVTEITGSILLKRFHADIIAAAQHPMVCDLLNHRERDLSNIAGYTTSEQTSDCETKFNQKKGKYFRDLPYHRVQSRRVFLVRGTLPSFPFKSWTTHDKKTFLFTDANVNSEDLKRSLIHEYYLSQDVKYDATLWEWIVEAPKEILFGEWGKEFFAGWFESPLIRIGLAVARSERVEELILTGSSEIPAGTCYGNLQNRLLRLLEQQDVFANVLDGDRGGALGTSLSNWARTVWSYERKNNLVDKKYLATWVNGLARVDLSEKQCKFILDPLMGGTPNYVSVGPRPRIGTGVGGAAEARSSQSSALKAFDLLNELENETK